MQKPLILNRFLNKKWNDYETNLLSQKIMSVKASTSIKKNRLTKSEKPFVRGKKETFTEMREYEIQQNNKVLVNKLRSIFEEKPKRLKVNRVSEPKVKSVTSNKKWELYQITKENQSILKRIHETNSVYKREKYENDYLKREKYMTNICEFPVLNFNPSFKTNNQSFSFRFNKQRPNTQGKMNFGKLNQPNLNNEEVKYSTHNNFYRHNEFSEKEDPSEQNNNEIEDQDGNQYLYKKKVMLGSLGSCFVFFYIENKEFKIKVMDGNISYILEIDNIEDILRMQNLYKNYDQIIEKLEFEDNELKLIQDKDNYISYRTSKLCPAN